MVKKKKVKKRISSKKLNKDYDIAYDFATKVYKQFKEVVKSIVLFGSVAKFEPTKGSDIDLIIIIDDCSIEWDQELIAWYREELAKLISKQSYAKKLHINTVTLSAFWEDIKTGEPAAVNIIRYGQALIDFGGFFDPLKVMLAKGKIRPTPEAVFTTLRRGPIHISKAKISIINSIENLYWAMVDSSHAALMSIDKVPPSPEHIPQMLYEEFVKKKKLENKYISWFRDLQNIAKGILHGNIKLMSGKEIDKHIKKVQDFEKKMRTITIHNLEKDNDKIIRVKRKRY